MNAAGTTRVRGLEADFALRATSRPTIGASYAFTHWRAPPTPNPPAAGNPLQPLFIIYTPRHAASGSIDYAIPVRGDTEVRLHLGGNFGTVTGDYANFNAPRTYGLEARLAF